MSGILKVSEATALAFHACLALSENPDGKTSVHVMADRFQASKAHLAKVMQRLVKAGLVLSERGPAGGFSLAKPLKEVSLHDIYEAIEGTFPNRACLFNFEVCGDTSKCQLRGFLRHINDEVETYFRETTLDKLSNPT